MATLGANVCGRLKTVVEQYDAGEGGSGPDLVVQVVSVDSVASTVTPDGVPVSWIDMTVRDGDVEIGLVTNTAPAAQDTLDTLDTLDTHSLIGRSLAVSGYRIDTVPPQQTLRILVDSVWGARLTILDDTPATPSADPTRKVSSTGYTLVRV